MKSAEDLKARLGGHMRESMGAHRPDRSASSAIPAPAFHGETKYRGAARVKDALAIELDRIVPDPDQPRREFPAGALAELAASLKARGQLQPARVRWDATMERWVIISGERRYRAALIAGLPTLMAVEAKGELDPDEVLEDQIVENCLRDDLKPIEQARAFKTLIDRRGLTYRQLSEKLHVSTGSISRALALLTLPEDIQRQVEAEAIPASAAAELAKVADDQTRREILGKLVSGALTRDGSIDAVREATGRSTVERGKPRSAKGRGARPKGKPKLPTERVLRTSTGLKVTISARKGFDLMTLLAGLEEVTQGVRDEVAAGRDQ